jgi:hypothetical protein
MTLVELQMKKPVWITLELCNWWGLKNGNTCLLEIWFQGLWCIGNCGLTVLPLRFWEEFGVTSKLRVGSGRRFWVGLGLFSFFVTWKGFRRSKLAQPE